MRDEGLSFGKKVKINQGGDLMFTSKRQILSAIVLGMVILLGISLFSLARVTDDLQLGPRPQGMGGAFIALADDINAGYWNPAGIPQLNKKALGFMHSNPSKCLIFPRRRIWSLFCQTISPVRARQRCQCQ